MVDSVLNTPLFSSNVLTKGKSEGFPKSIKIKRNKSRKCVDDLLTVTGVVFAVFFFSLLLESFECAQFVSPHHGQNHKITII